MLLLLISPLILFHLLAGSLAQDFSVLINSSSPLTLAIQPACGTLDSENFTEINTGIKLGAIRLVFTLILARSP